MGKLEKISKKWNALSGDVEKWKYLLSHKKEIAIRLDNDGTYCTFCEGIIPNNIDNYDDLPELNSFEDWVGNSPGLDILFPILGIEAEGV